MVFNGTFRLKFENLLLLVGRDSITLLDMLVGNFLNLIMHFKVPVLGKFLVIFQFFQFFINAPSVIPDRDFGILNNFFNNFNKLFSAFFGSTGYRNTDNFTVIHWIKTQF